MDNREYARVKREFLAETFGDGLPYVEAFREEADGQAAPQPPQASMDAPVRAARLSSANAGADPVVPERLEELLESAKRQPTLGAWIREKAHRLDRVRYKPAYFEQGQVSRDYWSRLLNDEVKASKEKLLRVAVLLELEAEEAEAMLELAGYSFSPTILRDVVVLYCLRKELYDFIVIEQLLADHEVQSLFNDRRV